MLPCGVDTESYNAILKTLLPIPWRPNRLACLPLYVCSREICAATRPCAGGDRLATLHQVRNGSGQARFLCGPARQRQRQARRT
jgi:hypothetical protein